MTTERSPGWKLFLAGIIGIALVIPLMMVYALVWDRQEQSNVAQSSIAAGWGGPQVVVGPVLVIPYTREQRRDGGRERTADDADGASDQRALPLARNQRTDDQFEA